MLSQALPQSPWLACSAPARRGPRWSQPLPPPFLHRPLRWHPPRCAACHHAVVMLQQRLRIWRPAGPLNRHCWCMLQHQRQAQQAARLLKSPKAMMVMRHPPQPALLVVTGNCNLGAHCCCMAPRQPAAAVDALPPWKPALMVPPAATAVMAYLTGLRPCHMQVSRVRS